MPQWEVKMFFTTEGPRGENVRASSIQRFTTRTKEEAAVAAVENLRDEYSGDAWDIRVITPKLIRGNLPRNTAMILKEKARYRATLKNMLR